MLLFLKRYFFIAAILLCLLPFSGAVYLLLEATNEDIAFTEKELTGLRYHQALFTLLITAHEYRGQSYIATPSNQDTLKLQKLEEKIVALIENIDRLENDAKTLTLLSQWQDTKKAVLTMFEVTASETPKERFNQHTHSLSLIKLLMQKVGNLSNLILDPQMGTYYTMNVLVNIMPNAIWNLGYLRGTIARTIAAAEDITSQEHMVFEIKGKLATLVDQYRDSIAVIEEYDPESINAIERHVRALDQMEISIALVTNMIDYQVGGVTHEKIFAEFGKSIAVFQEAYTSFAEHLDLYLKKRIDEYKLYRLKMLLTLSTTLIVAFSALFFARRDILHQKIRAERASRAKSEFLANMSHEIRTPMNGVLGVVDMLRETDLNPEQSNWVNIIKKSGDALLEIINDILDLSKIESGILELEEVNFSLYSVVEDVTDFMMFKTQEQGIELLVEFEKVPDYYIGDVGRIRQILLNLISNAIKFTQKGYVVLRISSINHGDSAELLMEVEDTGIGIPESKYESIFDKFVQAEESTTRKFGGTGLGLPICKDLAKLMGGDITVRSEIGKGSVFSFSVKLPYGKNERKILNHSNVDISGLNILVVDDLPVNGYILSRYVLRWVKNCDVTLSATEAMDMLQKAHSIGNPYDLVFIDRQMPEINGIKLANNIKNDPELKNTALIMLTSSSSGAMTSPEFIHKQGFLGFCLKPYHPLQLKNLILSVWDAYKKGNTEKLITDRSVSSASFHNREEKILLKQAVAAQERKAHILVVDDMSVNRLLLTNLLTKLGYRSVTATNGIEAISALESENFDMVFMDCHMPEMDGYDCTRAIRDKEKNEDRKRLPVIALTADAIKGNEQRCLEAGMDDFLTKPINKTRIETMLNKWLETA
ncbi:MAG: response regulator [Pseudomonadota bacterium]